MQIQQIKCNTQNFKQNWRVFCYDDEMSKQKREHIREHIEKPLDEYAIINTGRLDEYELNQLIKGLVLNKAKIESKKEENPEIDEELLEIADFSNIHSLYGENSYRAGLNNITLKQIRIAKQAGIKHIVNLRHWAIDEQCEGISYYNFPIDGLYDRICLRMTEEEWLEKHLEWEPNPESLTDEQKEAIKNMYKGDARDLCNMLVEFIQTMQKGNVLIGCELGTDKTDFALWLNEFFNPKTETYVDGALRGIYIDIAKKIYQHLSQEDKKVMGWDEEFDKNFLKRFEGYYC